MSRGSSLEQYIQARPEGPVRVVDGKGFALGLVESLTGRACDARNRGDMVRVRGATATDPDIGYVCEWTGAAYAWQGFTLAANDARYVNVSGDTMTGDLDLNSGTVTELGILASLVPLIRLTDSGAAADAQQITIRYDGGSFIIRLTNDDNSTKSQPLTLTDAKITWNDSGRDTDYVIEGDTDANLFYLDASTDRVGIGAATPASKLDVAGLPTFRDPTDTTKAATLALSGITTGTTRTYTAPNQSGGLAVTDSTAGVRIITASATFDPPDTANGAFVSTTITATGAAVGDTVLCQHTTLIGPWISAPLVESADTVRCRFQNVSGGNINAASGTLRATVIKAL